MTATGSVLRHLRSAARLKLEHAAAQARMSPLRLRDLERGAAELTYVEGFRLAPVYLLSTADLSKHLLRSYAEDSAESLPQEDLDAA